MESADGHRDLVWAILDEDPRWREQEMFMDIHVMPPRGGSPSVIVFDMRSHPFRELYFLPWVFQQRGFRKFRDIRDSLRRFLGVPEGNGDSGMTDNRDCPISEG